MRTLYLGTSAACVESPLQVKGHGSHDIHSVLRARQALGASSPKLSQFPISTRNTTQKSLCANEVQWANQDAAWGTSSHGCVLFTTSTDTAQSVSPGSNGQVKTPSMGPGFCVCVPILNPAHTAHHVTDSAFACRT